MTEVFEFKGSFNPTGFYGLGTANLEGTYGGTYLGSFPTFSAITNSICGRSNRENNTSFGTGKTEANGKLKANDITFDFRIIDAHASVVTPEGDEIHGGGGWIYLLKHIAKYMQNQYGTNTDRFNRANLQNAPPKSFSDEF